MLVCASTFNAGSSRFCTQVTAAEASVRTQLDTTSRTVSVLRSGSLMSPSRLSERAGSVSEIRSARRDMMPSRNCSSAMPRAHPIPASVPLTMTFSMTRSAAMPRMRP